MNVSIENMKSYIQEWFVQCLNLDDLRDVYYGIRFEIDKQFEYMAHSIIVEKDMQDIDKL